MKESYVHASFVTPASSISYISLNSHNHQLLKDTPPSIISALHSLYPLLVSCNRILSFITWTSSKENSHYRNIVIIMLYSIMILHWNNYFVIILPTLLILCFCCYVWFIKVSYIDEKYHLNGKSVPTIEEVLDTLDNFTIRCSFISNFSSNYSNLLTPLTINLILLTPFYVYLMKNCISIDVWLITTGIFFSTYYSSWSIALRRLLWRSKYTRLITSFLTNEKYSMVDKENEISIMNLDIKGTIDENTKIVEFQVLENERRWVGLGWSKHMLFFDKAPYCSIDMQQQLNSLKDYRFPITKKFDKSEWKWLDSQWNPLPSSRWVYYDNRWKHPSHKDSVTKYTRSRRLRRQCLVVLKK